MNKFKKTENVKLNLRSEIFYLAILILFSSAIAGCNVPKRKAVATWRGNLIEEKRINEKIEYSKPSVDGIDWESKPGMLSLSLKQNSIANYDSEKIYQKIRAVRVLSTPLEINMVTGHEGVIGRVVCTAVIAGLWAFPAMDKKNAEIERDAIQKLKTGLSSVTTEYYASNPFGPEKAKGVTPTYEREVLYETDKEILYDQTSQSVIPMPNISVKLINSINKDKEIVAESDKNGVVTFPIAESIRKANELKEANYKVYCKWEDNWEEIGVVELKKEHIAQIINDLMQSNLAATGVPDLPPFATITTKLSNTEVKADGDCDLSLTVANTGKGEFYKLVAVSQCEIPEINGLIFKFGKLDPDDSLTLTKKVHIPREQLTGPVAVEFVWSELNGYEPEPVQAKIMVKGLPRPVFATSVQILDDNTGNSVGNGDGLIQKGEAVDLLVTIKNIGDGAARNVTVGMDEISIPDVVINIKEQKLGEIVVGQSKQARLTITTKRAAEIDKLNPTIRVLDEYFGQEHTEQLALALETELAPSIMAYNMQVYVGSDEIPVRGGAGNETAIIARAKPGTTLNATGELGNWIRVEMPSIGTGWVQRSMISFESTSLANIVSQSSGGVIEILQKQPPLIAIAKPLNNSKLTMGRVEVSGVIADDQAVSLAEFKLNDQKIDLSSQRGIDRIDKAPDTAQRELNFSFTVDLAEGTNTIEITALDNDGLEAKKAISVIYEKEQGNIYIVSIGIDKYQNIRPLKYAVDDSKAVAECLKKSLNVPEENVYCLFNEDATLRNIRDTLGVKVRERAGKADTVIIYFSGHGAPEADQWSADGDGVAKYLLPIEAEQSSLYSTALPMEEVRTIFRRLISERVIFMADTCYSGEAGGRTLMPDGTSFRSIKQDNLLRRLRETGAGRVILTASQGSEVSQEKDELSHGVFTYYLLKGLEGNADNNQDNIITVTELYQYVSKEVPKATKNTQHPMMDLDEMSGEVVVGVLE
ncbi:MAG: caspase family protein [Sedimentisphaerales bacterium]|nr:caspase family protein [Sedimentisphaerales bacterium]